jgi:hypothetical protein
LEVSGTVVAGAGTALLPSITTTGDLNTGMWFPAADTIAFSEGGVEALRIDSSGNVGIGDSTFAAGKLQVYDSAGNHVWLKGRASDGTSSVSFRNNADNIYNGRIEVADTGGMLFQVAGSTRATIDTNGNLLVGTESFTGTSGVSLSATGYVYASSTNDVAIYANRETSDGDIAVFRKDGSTVGSIGTKTSMLTIGSGDVGQRPLPLRRRIPWRHCGG